MGTTSRRRRPPSSTQPATRSIPSRTTIGARALAALSRHEEAVAEYARAIELDREAAVLPDWEVDDGLFSTVVAWGQALGGVDEKLRALGRYKELLPSGSHLTEAEEWSLRFRGLLPTTFIKPRD